MKSGAMVGIRIVPCLDVTEGRVVKGVRFVDLQDHGDPVELAHAYEKQGADELCFLDITATSDDRSVMLDVVRRTAAELFMPLTVGGGVRSLADATRLLHAGADRISVNSAAVRDPRIISELSDHIGSQSVVGAVDAKRVGAGRWSIFTHGGRRDAEIDAVEWAVELVGRGAGELLVTSMDRDGTGEGFDTDLLASIGERVDVPIIASGGAGRAEHFADAVLLGGADAVLAAGLFHRDELVIGEVRDVLLAKGLPVRSFTLEVSTWRNP